MPDPATPGRRTPRRVWVLLALLLVAAGAWAVTMPMRARMAAETRRDLRVVEHAERLMRAEQEALAARQERVAQLERLAASPEDYDLLMQVGARYGLDRRYDEAQFLFHEALRLHPERAEPYRALHEAFLAQGKLDRAYDALTEGLRRMPNELELLLGLIHLDAAIGWNIFASERLRTVSDPKVMRNPRFLVARALVRRQLSDARHSEEYLREALKIEPENSKLKALLSSVLHEHGHLDEAESSIRDALRQEPENVTYLMHLCDVLLGRPNPQHLNEVERIADRVLAIDPSNQNAQYARIKVAVGRGDSEAARVMLEELIRRHPNHPLALLELGTLYSQGERRNEGRALLARYSDMMERQSRVKGLFLRVGMQPKEPAGYVRLGRALYDNRTFDKAIVVLRRALQLRKDEPGARELLTRALVAAGRVGEVDELLQRPDWHLDSPLSTAPF